MTGRVATGVERRERMQAVARNCGTSRSDGKGEAQAAKTARRAYRAEHWDGPTRTSEEGPVMGLEQRGRVRRSHLAKQLETG